MAHPFQNPVNRETGRVDGVTIRDQTNHGVTAIDGP